MPFITTRLEGFKIGPERDSRANETKLSYHSCFAMTEEMTRLRSEDNTLRAP